MKNIIVLGSTGSVGKNVLDVVGSYPGKFRIKGLSSNANVELLSEQARRFKPDTVVIGDEKFYGGLKKEVPRGTRVLCGVEGTERLATEKEADIIFLAISGTSALGPLVAALSSGKTVALASKEPIVSAGEIITKVKEKSSARIIPVDSEHSAVMQCLLGRKKENIRTIYITGSGGSLNGVASEVFDSLTVKQVLAHPKWDMGPKITVDSATLMNKGLEVIEARWLFDIPQDRIKVVIHPEAIIHSMVEFIDGTVCANLFCPDMRFPILRALTYPDMVESALPRVDFGKLAKFSFTEPDAAKFPALTLAYEALRSGGTMPAVLNGADEAAVKLFLEGKIKFTDIFKKVEGAMRKHQIKRSPSLGEIVEAETWATEEVLGSL